MINRPFRHTSSSQTPSRHLSSSQKSAGTTLVTAAMLICVLNACSDTDLQEPSFQTMSERVRSLETVPPSAQTPRLEDVVEESEALADRVAPAPTGTLSKNIADKPLIAEYPMQMADATAGTRVTKPRLTMVTPEPILAHPVNRERYASMDLSSVKYVADEPVSTFSVDVDTGSYANVRRHLEHGSMPPANSVRVEEMINYFDYDYALPLTGDAPFSVSTALAPTPWNDSSELLRIAIKGVDVEVSDTRSANLVFLVDVSGSMDSPDKLGLLKSSLSLLARGLDGNDRVSIVTYAGAVGTVLDGAAGNDQQTIDRALARLTAGGSTAGGAGIEAAYTLARRHATENSVNRVILATDGDFNVGLSDTDSLIDLVEHRREQGTALTTLGFGTGNYNDELMEQLADAGNGNHAYIDTLGEARKVLSQQLNGTLFTIAKDVKIQIEFNPAKVSEYRLIGYENRALADEDFKNDKVDAGEIGAGHTVTALYEIVRTGNTGWLSERRYVRSDATQTRDNELGELRLRYKQPDGATSQQLTEIISSNATLGTIEDTDTDFRFATAVSAFGERLRDDRYLGNFDYDAVLALARSARGDDPFGYRAGFIELVELARVLDNRPALSRRGGEERPDDQDSRG